MKHLLITKAALTAPLIAFFASASVSAQESEPLYLGVMATPYSESKAYISGHRDAPEGRSIFITIPESIADSNGNVYTIDSIGPNSLNNIENLTCVRIPGSVRSIAEHAFSYSPNLKALFIGDGVERIESAAFYDCNNLREVSIPASVKYIHPEAFWATNISSFDIDPANRHYKSVDGAIYTADGKTLVRIPHGTKGSFTVKPGTRVLGENSCRSDEMTEIILPEGIEEIKYGAFLWDTKLEKVKLPESLRSIGPTAFGQCHSLKEIVLPPKALDLSDNIFYQCKNLESVTLPSDLEYIPETMFDYCGNLKSISLPSNIRRIDDRAFNCCGFTEFSIPATVTQIGENPWSGCSQLKSLNTAASNPAYKTVDGILFTKEGKTIVAFPAGRTGRYVVPEGVTTLGKLSFSWTDLNEIILPKSLVRIDDEAFEYSHYMSEIEVPENVSYIGDDAFAYSDIRTISILNPEISHIGKRIADEKATLYIPDNCLEHIRSSIPEGTDLTKDPQTGAFFSLVESFGVHDKSEFDIKPLSAKPKTIMCTAGDLISYPFGVAKSKNVWKLTAAELTGILEKEGITYKHDNANEIFVLRQIFTDVPGRGRTQVLNHRAYIDTETGLMKGFDFLITVPDKSELPAFLGYLDEGVRKAGYKIDSNFADKKPTSVGGVYLYATKGDKEILLAYDSFFESIMVIITYKDSPLKTMLNRIPEGKFKCPNMVD